MRALPVALVACLIAGPVGAQEVDDVVRMLRAGMDEDDIRSSVTLKRSIYYLTEFDRERLTRLGASPALIEFLASTAERFAPPDTQPPPTPAVRARAERVAAADADLARLFLAEAHALDEAGRHGLAHRAARRALAYDPDLEGARSRIGHVGAGGRWMPDPERAVPTDDLPTDRRIDPDALYARLVRNPAKRRIVELVEATEAAGDEAGVEGIWRRFLSIDPDDLDARAALGHERNELGSWVAAADRRRIADAAAGEPVDATALAERTGLAFTARGTRRLVVAATGPADALARPVAVGEAGFDLLGREFGLPATGRVHVALLASRADFARFVDRSVERNDEVRAFLGKTEWGVQSEVDPYYALLASGDRLAGEDAVLRSVGFTGAGATQALHYAWFGEAAHLYLAVRLLGAVRWFSTDETALVAADRDREPTTWGRRLRTAVALDEDRPLADLLTVRTYADLTAIDVLKGWSLLVYAVETDRDGLARFLAAVRHDRDPRPVLARAMGRATILEVDRDWRRWVLENH